MRQRNIKNLEARLAENASFLIEDPRAMRGKWGQVFGNGNPIFLEIGCGKGKFILSKAMEHPDCNFIAVEGQENVILRAMEKAEAAGRENGLSNLRLFIDYINDLNDYFEPGELAGIYLNFSDPWPKARHYKRRLTYRGRLLNYFQVLDEDGAIEFKTDNDGLFAFTMEEIEALIASDGIVIAEKTEDLHSTDFAGRLTTTEYEDKFKAAGKNINYVKIKRKSAV